MYKGLKIGLALGGGGARGSGGGGGAGGVRISFDTPLDADSK